MSESAPGPDARTLVGRIVAGRYWLLRLIGEGAFGAVYEAEHQPTGRHVAVKTLHPGLANEPEAVRRFQREAKAASLLDHPSIVEVLDLGTLETGGLFLAMELVSGVSVGELLELGPVAPRRTLVLLRQALEGVAFAHERGYVHRDLKPDNLMIVTVGEPGATWEQLKILDFGLVKLIGDAASDVGGSRLTATGVVFGTPAYMAPEQALGQPVDGRADLYALGVVLFEMLTGRKPFSSPDPMALLRLQVSAAPPPLADVAPGAPWLTPDLIGLVGRALAKRPEARFQSAAEMGQALEQAFVSIDHVPNL